MGYFELGEQNNPQIRKNMRGVKSTEVETAGKHGGLLGNEGAEDGGWEGPLSLYVGNCWRGGDDPLGMGRQVDQGGQVDSARQSENQGEHRVCPVARGSIMPTGHYPGILLL